MPARLSVASKGVVFMPEYTECPRCGRDDGDVVIYECDNGHVFCDYCEGVVLFLGKVCPECNSQIKKEIANIG